MVHPVSLSDAVLAEAEWVLHGRYDWGSADAGAALRGLLARATASLQRPEMLDWVLDQHGRGADWADMLHLIAVRHHQAFATFDQSLAPGSDATAPVAVELLK